MWQSIPAKAKELVLFPGWEVDLETRDVIFGVFFSGGRIMLDDCSGTKSMRYLGRQFDFRASRFLIKFPDQATESAFPPRRTERFYSFLRPSIMRGLARGVSCCFQPTCRR